MKNSKYLLRFVFILTLAFFVSQFNVAVQGQSFDERVLEKLDLKEGMIVAEVGAGNGKFAVKIARIVGLEGHVYANEIDEDRIQKIKSRIAEQGIENITIIHGEEEDAVLPVKVDFIILKFVYHHLSSPDNFMNNLLKYLNPGGRLAVIAADINHDNSDRVNKEDMDPCISDPEKTKKAIEKSGYRFEKREDVKQSKEVDYILIFKASEVVIAYCYQPRQDDVHQIYTIQEDGSSKRNDKKRDSLDVFFSDYLAWTSFSRRSPSLSFSTSKSYFA